MCLAHFSSGGHSTGSPSKGVSISGLTVQNVRGSVSGNAQRVYIACGSGSCHDWHWSGVEVQAGPTAELAVLTFPAVLHAETLSKASTRVHTVQHVLVVSSTSHSSLARRPDTITNSQYIKRAALGLVGVRGARLHCV